jgi:hypothetical protein
MKQWMLGLVAGAVAWTGTQSRAEYSLFTDRTAFNGAAYNLQTIDFEGLAPQGGIASYVTASGLTQKGVNFAGPSPFGNYLYVVDPAFSPSLYDWGSGAVLLGPAFGDGSQITVTLPAGITALGTDIMSTFPDGAPFDVTLASGDTFTVSTNPFPNRAFFGIVSDTPISSLSFTAEEGAFPLLDNFTFGQAVPAPPSLVLFGIGGIGAAICAWRRRRMAR